MDVNAAIPEMVLGRETLTTALIEAVRAGQKGVVEQLLMRGAARELASSDGTVSRSFLRVHWVAVPEEACARRANMTDLADGRRGRGQHGARAQAARGAAQPFRGRR